MADTLAAMGRPKKAEPTEPLRIPQSFVRRIRRVALHQDKDPGDYVAERFAGLLDQDEAAMFEDFKKERGEKKGARK
jgi:hypothetical protein